MNILYIPYKTFLMVNKFLHHSYLKIKNIQRKKIHLVFVRFIALLFKFFERFFIMGILYTLFFILCVKIKNLSFEYYKNFF